MSPAATERWLDEVFQEADAAADKATDFDAGTMFYGIVTKHIPNVALMVPSHLNPTMRPERIPMFYMWVRGWVLEGKV